MAHRALTDVLLGNRPAAHAGDLVPDTFVNMTGQEEPVDFDRLLELGAVEEVGAPSKPAPDEETEAEAPKRARPRAYARKKPAA